MTVRLWSLWEMLERYALIFSEALGSLSTAQLAWRSPLVPNNVFRDGALMTGAGRTPEHEAEVREDLEFRRKVVSDALERTEGACVLAGLTGVLPEIERLRTNLSMWRPNVPVRDIGGDIGHLRNRLRDELQNEYFLHVSRTDYQLYGQPEGFGPEVAAKFPTGVEDVEGAGNCLALGQPTACVFHLMRLAEIGVRALAKKLKVTTIDPETENWNTIIDHVNKAINALPAKTVSEKARKAALAGASAHMNVIRIATRNEVMHPKKTYTQEEARDSLQATRLFMRHLAGLV